VIVNLDRVLVSIEWENMFPKCFAWNKTRVGSDHWPVMLDTGECHSCRENFFFFEKQWLLEEDFIGKFGQNWQIVRSRFSRKRYSIDIWHGCLSLSRQYLRGWAANKIGETRRIKLEILSRLEELDKKQGG
jgi:hypothetical protein